MNALRGRGTWSSSLRRRWRVLADSKGGEEGFGNGYDEGSAYELEERMDRELGVLESRG